MEVQRGVLFYQIPTINLICTGEPLNFACEVGRRPDCRQVASIVIGRSSGGPDASQKQISHIQSNSGVYRLNPMPSEKWIHNIPKDEEHFGSSCECTSCGSGTICSNPEYPHEPVPSVFLDIRSVSKENPHHRWNHRIQHEERAPKLVIIRRLGPLCESANVKKYDNGPYSASGPNPEIIYSGRDPSICDVSQAIEKGRGAHLDRGNIAVIHGSRYGVRHHGPTATARTKEAQAAANQRIDLRTDRPFFRRTALTKKFCLEYSYITCSESSFCRDS